MQMQSERDRLIKWVGENKGVGGVKRYKINKNAYSIDGLPAPGLAD
jgi:hypothetical protein